MPLRMNVLSASAGVVTIGSPRRLNDVFRSAGHPGRLAEPAYELMVPRVGVGCDGLHSGGAVDVGHRGNARSCVLLDRNEQQHEPRGIVTRRIRQVEELGRPVLNHRRRERAVRLDET